MKACRACWRSADRVRDKLPAAGAAAPAQPFGPAASRASLGPLPYGQRSPLAAGARRRRAPAAFSATRLLCLQRQPLARTGLAALRAAPAPFGRSAGALRVALRAVVTFGWANAALLRRASGRR